MDSALKINKEESIKVIAYADDIAVLVAGTDFESVKLKASDFLTALKGWAEERGLTFSSGKSQALVFKGNPMPIFSVPFGNENIVLVDKVRYLGVVLDKGRNFWAHIQSTAGKSDMLYSRLRAATSADWGIKQATSRVIYRAVFLPRITYASEIWGQGVRTRKAIRLLGSKQRRALLSITGAYSTTSTDALQVVAGQLPLDLEIEWNAFLKESKSKSYTKDEVDEFRELILEKWQNRWSRSVKGRWTYSMIPDVRKRLSLPLSLDHYTTQFLTGHGDFNAKLKGFRLVEDAMCSCGLEQETVEHVLFRCMNYEEVRNKLRRTINKRENSWPCMTSVFLQTRSNFEALKRFSGEVLRSKKVLE